MVATVDAEVQVEAVESDSALTENSDSTTSPVQKNPSQSTDSVLAGTGLPEGQLPKGAGSDQPVIGDFTVPGKQTLADLIGQSEVSVSVDINDQFVKSMAENKIIEEDIFGQVDEANLIASISAGRSFNRQSRAALARTEQAKAQTEQALAFLRPYATVRVASGVERSMPGVEIDESGEQVSSDNHSRTDVALTLRQPLFNLPNYLDWQRRKVVERARGENYRVYDGDAYLATVEAYLSLVSSRVQTDMTRDFEAQLGDLLNYIEKRASAGAASVSDMARVRARIEATLSSRLEQESAYAAARIEFVRLTNLVPRAVRLPELNDIGAALLPESLDVAIATAIEHNPEIAALAAELEAARIEISAAKGRFLPSFDAEYTDSYSLGAGGDTSSSGQRDKRAMLVMNWSLFNGGGDYQYHTEKNARQKELQYRLDDQRRLIVQAIAVNYAALTTTRARIASGYHELKSISTAAEAMSKRMLSGNQSLLDLLDVYDRYYQVRSRLVSLHVWEMNAVAQLVRLMMGTPWAASEGAGEIARVEF